MRKQFSKIAALLALLCVAGFAQEKGTLKDHRDGKAYRAVKIGSQIWMSENLNYGGENGDIGVCPDNDPKNCEKYGRLYNWEDAMLACPDGWHLPSEEEWQSLANFAGGAEIAGRKLKAKNGWEKWECESTVIDNRGRATKVSKCNLDSYGFFALPSTSKSQSGFWWTASENYSSATAIIVQYNLVDVRWNSYGKSQVFNVRCLRGEKKLPSDLASKKSALEIAEVAKKEEKIAEAANPLTTEVTEEGTILRGSTLAKKLAWLDRSAESHETYIIEVNANENIAPHTFDYKGAIDITIILRGDYENRTIRLKSHGNMFTVKQNVTFVLDNNITLMGHNGNTGNIINVEGGAFKMNDGATITNNIMNGGVHVYSGTFEMNGGIISNNGKNTDFMGGGVDNRGTFTMNGGTVSGNIASIGGGVYNRGTFTMNGGNISSNNARKGGGVYNEGTFKIRGNSTITANTASEYGGGVYIESNSWSRNTFTKTGGTITGYSSDRSDGNIGNIVKDEDGVIARRGHAVAYDGAKQRKETTAEQDDDLSCERGKCTGNWDN